MCPRYSRLRQPVMLPNLFLVPLRFRGKLCRGSLKISRRAFDASAHKSVDHGKTFPVVSGILLVLTMVLTLGPSCLELGAIQAFTAPAGILTAWMMQGVFFGLRYAGVLRTLPCPLYCGKCGLRGCGQLRGWPPNSCSSVGSNILLYCTGLEV